MGFDCLQPGVRGGLENLPYWHDLLSLRFLHESDSLPILLRFRSQ